MVLNGLPWLVCLVYLDDIIVHAHEFQDELRRLREVFLRLRAAKKCQLCRREVSYLRHVITRNGVSPDPEKTKAVMEWPVPRTSGDVRRFLELCTYYRKFVPSFSTLAKPLHVLASPAPTFDWTDECDIAFTKMKELLTSPPVLGYPSEEGYFTLDTDASEVGLGAVLSQRQGPIEQVIAYYSHTLSRAEKNYCATRKELLAVVASIGHFHYYLYGRKFTVRSDHSALQWLFNFRNPEGQIARWIQKLQEYDFDVIHRRGTSHQNADALSRWPCFIKQCTYCPRLDNKEKESKTEGSLKMKARQVSARINEENFPQQSCWSTDKIRKEQEADQTLIKTYP